MYPLLLILCILSLIGSFGGILYGMGLSSLAAVSSAELSQSLSIFGMESNTEMISQMTTLIELGPLFIVFNIVEIAGIIMIMRGNGIGFHIYAASQIGLAGLMVITSGWAGAMLYILWNAFWVMTYWRTIKSAELYKQEKSEKAERGATTDPDNEKS